MEKAWLVLADGTRYEGYSFGYRAAVSGEVVFNTAMTGYPESLTDPSYTGQILVATYPLIGNYGVPDMQEEHNLLTNFESGKVHITALVVSDYSLAYSHWNAERSLGDWLNQHQVPAICGLDTRAITKKIREHGAMPGKIVFSGLDTDLFNPDEVNLVADVSTTEVLEYGEGELHIGLLDCGVKNNIIRCLIRRGVRVSRLPWDYNFNNDTFDGLMISNGPGNPVQCVEAIAHIRQALKGDVPVFGICLGNQLMALAAGANTYKLPYGHRSHNQPVLRVGTNRGYITSQNHGYAVDDDSLPEGWEPMFVNLNDGTNEGMRHQTKPFFSVQFHPEASGGPADTEFLFDEFLNAVKNAR